MNPFISEVDLGKGLISASNKGVNVKIIRRPAKSKGEIAFHEKMKKTNIEFVEHKTVHAKVIIVDRQIAVISSMNFNQASGAGSSWEAGLVTIDKDTVEDIWNSIEKFIVELT